MKKAIIYLHGFNSASLDLHDNLLISKEKLQIMQEFCLQKDIYFYSPNVDYRDFEGIVEDMLLQWNQFLDQSCDVSFMGSSMGGFASEYLAMKTGCKAFMINPAIAPNELLTQFIGVTENYETGQPYQWELEHCEQYAEYEQELNNSRQVIDRTILLDMADELIDSANTVVKYKDKANIQTYQGGSHSFEHMRQALSIIEQALFS
ncbi:YqiA/YcfP family alpha/beta fold hydrolase [Methyloprofundus sp.]|uniref:YqiA/YcfP family alpha/beta fold hydrolase n=1 Tax=Methyloprofundus sp. TaxID=2020875 RepID=UPI003D0ACED5